MKFLLGFTVYTDLLQRDAPIASILRTEAYYFRGNPVICPLVVCPGGDSNFQERPDI